MRIWGEAMVGAIFVLTAALSGCTGGQEGSAAEEQVPKKNPIANGTIAAAQPQVYHSYTTYLAQFRAYPPHPPFPPQQNWRTLEVQLNQAMQDPFIPGDTLKPGDRQITLQVAETEAAPKTVIRYIIMPATGGQQVAAK